LKEKKINLTYIICEGSPILLKIKVAVVLSSPIEINPAFVATLPEIVYD